MTTDELKALLDGATPGPWEAVLDVFWSVYVADGGDYAGQCVGDMNESAAMWRSPSDEQPDDFAEANARLIALAPVLAAEVIAIREREARLVGALAAAMYACRVVDEAVKEGHQSLPALVNHFLQAVEPARAALAEIEKEGWDGH